MEKTPKSAQFRPPILIVDDDEGQRSLLHSFLSGQDFEILLAASGEQALSILEREKLGLMISDVRMPGLSGLETLRRVRQQHPHLPVLLVTAYADIREAVDAMRDGALDYLSKPIDLDELLATVQKAVGLDARTQIRLAAEFRLPADVIAQSPLFQAVLRDVSLVAPSESRVLITGESGVGKEIIADLIHRWSPRAQGPLVKVNCAALPENLLESELFGHEKGAFTGATGQRIGRFEEASQGSLLLDEISEISPRLQAKLLRITQNGSFQRVGSNKDRHTAARLLAATNRNLENEVQAGRFREDLFYRLNVIEINIPPLRERRADILPLARSFLSRYSSRGARLSPPVSACLERYHWPGNVRELQNAMERAALLCLGDLILLEHLPQRISSAFVETRLEELPPASNLEEMERQTILQALEDHHFNRTSTAEALGLSRRALIYKLRRYRELGYSVDLTSTET